MFSDAAEGQWTQGSFLA